MMPDFHDELYGVLLDLWKLEAIKIKTAPGEGFKLKKHEKNPGLPLSPIYLNLRTPDNKGGTLTPPLIERMAELIWYVMCTRKTGLIAGLPHAGTPFEKALTTRRGLTALTLIKHENSDGTRVIAGLAPGGEREVGGSVVLIDDLITEADSKLEAARVLTLAGYTVPLVAVFCDREQGGREMLSAHGIQLASVVTLSHMLDFYVEEGLLSEHDDKIVRAYLANK